MSVKTFIDHIRFEAQEQGLTASMARGRDLVARILFDSPFNAVVAAERAGKFLYPGLSDARSAELKATYGTIVDTFVSIAAKFVELYPVYRIIVPLMTAKEAVAMGRIPEPPQLTLSSLEVLQEEARSRGMEIEWVTFNPGNLHQGRHLRFIRTGGNWYALDDMFLDNGEAYITAELNGSVFRYREIDDVEGTHKFLCHSFLNGKWVTRAGEHTMAYSSQLDMTHGEIVDG